MQRYSTSTGNQTQVGAHAIDRLEERLRGALIRSDDRRYDSARRVYNAMIDRHPLLIVECADTADVTECLRFSRDNSIPLSVRGGGHSGPGLGVCDDGIVIDLSQMNGVRVDPAARTARVEGGCTWADVDHATHAFGLATVSGVVSTTGVGGLTLGGGHGHLTRKYGLTIDNLISADVILADGRFVTASTRENADLFWAIRGGGGNFGVVTSFLFELHPVDTVNAGLMVWPLEQADRVIRWYRDFIPGAPEELNGFFAMMSVPPIPLFPNALHNQIVGGIVWCYCGPPEGADAAMAPTRTVDPAPVFEHVGPMPYPKLQSLFDPLLPPGLQWYWKGNFYRELTDDCIAEHIKWAAQFPTALSTIHLYPIDGAVHRVGKNDTAFSYRDCQFSEVVGGVDPDPANKDRITNWSRDAWNALQPYSAGGAYVNFMMEEGIDRVRATYRDNFDRLERVKAKYDPGNVFRSSQNIPPAQ